MANGSRRRRSSGRSSGGASRSRSSGRSRGGSSRSGGSRGGARRGGSRSRSGGGNNALPMVIAAIAVLLVIGVIVATSGKKQKKKEEYVSEEMTSESVVDKTPERPKQPERPPPPDISEEIIATAKEIVEWMDDELGEANQHYDEAMAAKNSGDEDTWQSKLHEAREHYLNIRERWNNEVIAEIEGELPMGCQWDAEEVANHHVGKEGGKVTKALDRLAYISKQLRR